MHKTLIASVFIFVGFTALWSQETNTNIVTNNIVTLIDTNIITNSTSTSNTNIIGTPTKKPKIPKKGLGFKPIPLIAYDTDAGLGLGLTALLSYYDGKTKDYQWKMLAEFYWSTGGELRPKIVFDFPKLKIGTQPFRLQGRAEYTIALFESYYGYGNSDTEINYSKNLATNYYYNYKKTNPFLNFTISTPILWGREKGHNKTFDFLFGSYIEWCSFTNSTTGEGIIKASKLIDEGPLGVDGGFTWSFSTGLRFDNRDFEPNPHSGTYNELMFEFSSSAWASSYNYSRITLKHSFYFEPFKNYKRIVVMERVWIDQLLGDAPFFKAEKFGGVDAIDGIGGTYAMRGMPKFRFKDNLKILISPEIRWRALDFGPLFGDIWHLEVLVFSDIGNVWADFSDININEITATFGFVLRILWDEDFIIAAAFGFWQEEFGSYIGFEQRF